MNVCQPATDLTLHWGDCLEVLPALPAASVHVVVTDPPYGLQFMGQGWDAPWRADRDIGRTRRPAMRTAGLRDGAHRLPWPQSAPGANVRCRRCRRWRVSSRPCRCAEPDFPGLRAAAQRAYQDWCTRWAAGCLRVLKPGGHLVAFGGTRTYHRLACAIEDAGFEIRDSIHWIYGQGFPKSLNVARALGQAGPGLPGWQRRPSQPRRRRVGRLGNSTQTGARADPAGPQATGRHGRRERGRSPHRGAAHRRLPGRTAPGMAVLYGQAMETGR